VEITQLEQQEEGRVRREIEDRAYGRSGGGEPTECGHEERCAGDDTAPPEHAGLEQGVEIDRTAAAGVDQAGNRAGEGVDHRILQVRIRLQ